MNNILFLLRYVIFWLIFFLINRILFILFFTQEVGVSPFLEIIKIFPRSFALDISFISYLLVIVVMLLWFSSFFGSRNYYSKITFICTAFFVFISSLINSAEISLYSEWNTKLNFTALSHLINPSEVFSTASLGHFFTTILFVLVGIFFVGIYKNKVHNYFPFQKTGNKTIKIIHRIVLFPLIIGIIFLGIRGGTQPIPVNLSNAYFSNNLILNDIAVNPNWNLMQSILKSKSSFQGNPYKKHSDKECQEFITSLYKVDKDSTIYVLNFKQPNIIFILLESWSADNIESLSGLKGITPNFRELEKKGILFTNFYSNGWTSDQGMCSIFSSFPVFPYVAVINQVDKSRKLPSLNNSLRDYYSSYFFGGQLTYGNIKGYLLSHGFDLVKDREHYDELTNGSLGIHDEYMFKEFKNELASLPQPFISSLFTISSHSPYDFPDDHKLSFGSKQDNYINSVAYTDKHLGDFMESVKNEEWYKNTLFIIVADHSHNSILRKRLAQKERFKIPMLWFGEVINDRFMGSIYDKMGSHIDITPTLLSQLDIDNSEYHWGRDLFNPNEKVAIPYAFHKGYGLIRSDGYFAFSESYEKIIESHGIDFEHELEIKKEAEMFFQFAFKEYMDL